MMQENTGRAHVVWYVLQQTESPLLIIKDVKGVIFWRFDSDVVAFGFPAMSAVIKDALGHVTEDRAVMNGRNYKAFNDLSSELAFVCYQGLMV